MDPSVKRTLTKPTNWLTFSGGLLLIFLLLRQINGRDVLDMLLATDPGWFLLACGVYVLANLLRAERFTVMLAMPGAWAPVTILPQMFALSLLNNVLPGRAGELSFPYYMYKRHGMSIGESGSALLTARIFDYVAIAVLYLFFTLRELDNLNPDAARIVTGVGVLLAISVLLLVSAPWLADAAVIFTERLLRATKRHEASPARSLIATGKQAAIALRRMRNPRTYLLTFVWSLAVWLVTFAWFAALMQAIGLKQRYPLVVVGSTFASLAKAIPFVTIGGFGAHEAGWTIGFTLTGMARETAIASGFAVNILTLLMSVIFGSAALIYLQRNGGEAE
ncbi:MAG: flippase-like domain-containing protein [Caldilineaceae bacterium]|nr:flippase-like domain-containing protein [Caldilineaceae bacterium]